MENGAGYYIRALIVPISPNKRFPTAGLTISGGAWFLVQSATCLTRIGVWKYPEGGKTLQVISGFAHQLSLQAVTFSPASP